MNKTHFETDGAQWTGELWLAREFAVLGGAGATSTHAHYAHQVLLSSAALTVRTMRAMFGVRADRALLRWRLHLAA